MEREEFFSTCQNYCLYCPAARKQPEACACKVIPFRKSMGGGPKDSATAMNEENRRKQMGNGKPSLVIRVYVSEAV